MLKLSCVALFLGCLLFCPLRGMTANPAVDDDPADATESADDASPDPSSEDMPDELPAATEPEGEPAEESTPAADSDTYDLKYKFAPGEVLRTEVVHRAAVQTTIDGTTQKAETQSKSIKCWRIDDVSADGDITFVHLVESIDMWQRTQGRKDIRYNSETDKDVPPGYEDAAKAVGVPLTVVTMDARGKVLKRKEHRSQPVSVSTQLTMPLPDHPISVGESWTSPIDIDVVLKDNSTRKIKTRQKFTLEKVDDDLATIAVDSQILTPISDPAIEAQLIQRLSSGTVRFDIARGRVLGQQLDLDRHVIGFSGAASSMHYVTRFTEQLLPPAEQTARRAQPRGGTVEPAIKQPSSAAKKKSPPPR